MKVYENILGLIGKTPLVKINNINEGEATILAKVEYFNPAGSIKDRIALNMIEGYEQEGKIKEGTTIIEPTSGNTGIGLAMVCSIKGYKLILTMPDTMSKERRDILKAYGAELVLTEGARGMQGAIDKANELNKQIQNSIIMQQFENSYNPDIHIKTTANEIYADTDSKVDIVVAGVGTGGTISGIGKKLKELNPDIKIVAYEPQTSPMLTKRTAGPHKIQGIGANFIPKNYNPDVVDEVLTIDNETAIEYTKKLVQEEGLFCGISSGGAIAAANILSKRKENEGKIIVAILPDTGLRYLSNLNFN